jgi:Tannase and feruloyl esterase
MRDQIATRALLVSSLAPLLLAACAGGNRGESPAATSSGADTCAMLASTSLPETAIVSAQLVPSGAFTPPAQGTQAPRPIENLPAFCRVVATLRPVPDEVTMEVWLPAQGWGGDFQPAGSSFWGGSLPYARMGELLRLGQATAGTNLGITGATGPSFAIEHPEKLAYLADVPYHATIERAKALIRAYYGRGPDITYMDECGGGGSRDALAMVQRHPEDLDAAAAVGFTNYGTRHGIHQMWVYQATHKTPASYIPPAKYPLIHGAALDACDAKDGVADGIMVPGMDHCFGEEYEHADTYRFDRVAFLKAWKASGQAPDRIVVTHAGKGEQERKRLVCAYPQVASYNGKGSTDDPANFSCRAPAGS